MSEALYRKWRPQIWEDVVGQDHIIQTLRNAIRADRIGHAYLLAGPRGTGKTTTARLLAKAANCLAEDPGNRPCNTCDHCRAVNANRFMDLIEIDAASNTSVEDVRDLREKIGFSPTQGQYKVYIIDEVHMLSTAAFNALLKTLEEPPAHAIFILATTEVHKIPATVLSRCQRHEFRRVPVNTIVSLLKENAQKENIQVDDETLTLIARQATGAIRDAISLLDQLSSTGEVIDLSRAQEVLGTATNQSVIDLVDSMLEKDAASGLDCIHIALDSGSDPRQFARQTVEYLRGLLLIRLQNGDLLDVPQDVRTIMARQANQFDTRKLIIVVRLFNDAANESRLAWQPSLALELAFAQAISSQAVQQEMVPEPAPETVPVAKASKSEKDDLEKVFQQKPAEVKKQEVKKEDGKELEEEEASVLTINQVQAAVPDVRTLIRKYRKTTEALLASARSYTVKKGVIVVGFQSVVLKNQFEKGEHMDITQRAFSHVLGIDAKVRAVIINSKDQIDETNLEIKPGSLVSTALDLGGKLVDKE